MGNIQPEILKTLKSDSLNKIIQGKKRTYSFNVDFSEVSTEFVGKFTLHYPSQLDKLNIGVVKSALLRGSVVDVITDNIAHIAATLDTLLDEKPEWFNLEDPDISYEILEAVFMEYTTWSSTFRNTATTNTNT